MLDRGAGRHRGQPRRGRTLAKANRESLNVEGTFQHVLTDLYGFIGTAVAAAIILLTGFERADPIVSLLIAGLMIRSGVALREGLGPRLPGGGAGGSRPDGRSARRWWPAGRRRGARSARVGNHERLPRALRARAGRAPSATATPPAATWRRCCTSASAWTTPPCRSTTPAASCWRSRCPPARARSPELAALRAAIQNRPRSRLVAHRPLPSVACRLSHLEREPILGARQPGRSFRATRGFGLLAGASNSFAIRAGR